MTIHRNATFSAGQLLPHELRRAVLFFDRIIYPKTPILFDTPEINFLEDAGIIQRPAIDLAEYGGQIMQHLPSEILRLFLNLEAKEEGAWAIAGGDSGVRVEGAMTAEGRGTLVELYRSIPVPDREVPLEDILNFKEKRRDEVVRLSIAMRGIYKDVESAADVGFELRRRKDEIDQICSDLIKVSKESKLPFRLSNLQIQFSLPESLIKIAFLLGSGVLPALEAVVGGALLSVSAGMGLKTRGSQTPFSYAASLEKDLL